MKLNTVDQSQMLDEWQNQWLITDHWKRFMSDKINPRLLKKTYESPNQLKILVENLRMKRWSQIIIEDLWMIGSIADLFWGFACE